MFVYFLRDDRNGMVTSVRSAQKATPIVESRSMPSSVIGKCTSRVAKSTPPAVLECNGSWQVEALRQLIEIHINKIE